jgi:WD40 repeat protein
MGSTRGESPAESLASRFERLWDATGTASDLNGFLQLHPDAGLRDRAEVVRVDQRRRWQAGRPRALEEYFRDCPDLAAHAAVKSALVVAEFRTAARNGRPYEREAFLARFADVSSLSQRLDDSRRPAGEAPRLDRPPVAGPAPAAAPMPAARKALVPDEMVVVQRPEVEEVYDFVDGDELPDVEILPPPAPIVPPPKQVIAASEDPEFSTTGKSASRSWPERVLVRRASAWAANPSPAAIPRPWELAAILLRTDRGGWTRRQRAVMAAAGRVYLIGTLVFAFGLIGVGLAGRYLLRRSPRAPVQLATIEPADPTEMARYARQLEEIQAELAGRRFARASELLDRVEPRWRDWEWRYLKRACHPRIFDIAAADPVSVSAVSADGRRLAAALDHYVPGTKPDNGRSEGRIQLWDLADRSMRELATFTGAGRFWRLAVSAKGERVAAATESTVHVWEVDSAKEVLRLERPVRSVADLALDADGGQLAIVESAGPIGLWKVEGGGKVATVGQEHPNFARVFFAPRGRRLAAEGGSRIGLWDTTDGRPLLLKPARYRTAGGVAVFSPDGHRLASDDDNGVIRLWDTEDGKELASFGKLADGAGLLAFSPDSEQLAGSGPTDGIVSVWDATTGQSVRTITLPPPPGPKRSPPLGLQDLAFSPDGKRMAAFQASFGPIANRNRTVLIWDAKEGGIPETIANAAQPRFAAGGRLVVSRGAGAPSSSAFAAWDPSGSAVPLEVAEAGAPSPDGSCLVTIGSNQIVSADDGRVVKVLNRMAPLNFDQVHYSPDGCRYVTLDRQKNVLFWDAATDTPLGKGREVKQGAFQFAFSANGARLITMGSPQDGVVVGLFGFGLKNNAVIGVWELERGELLQTIEGLYHRFAGRLAISPDGTRFAVGSLHQTVRVYDTDSGSVIWDLEGHTETAYGIVFHPDGRHLISSGLDLLEDRVTKGEVKVWDLETGRAVREFPGPTLVAAISPDGRLAFAADFSEYERSKPGRRRLKVWDLAAGETHYQLDEPLGMPVFSPDGKRFAMLENDAVAIHETTTGTRLLRLPAPRFRQDPNTGPRGRLVTNPLVFGSDGRRLVLPGRMLIPARGNEDRQVVEPTRIWSAPGRPDAPERGEGAK